MQLPLWRLGGYLGVLIVDRYWILSMAPPRCWALLVMRFIEYPRYKLKHSDALKRMGCPGGLLRALAHAMTRAGAPFVSARLP